MFVLDLFFTKLKMYSSCSANVSVKMCMSYHPASWNTIRYCGSPCCRLLIKLVGSDEVDRECDLHSVLLGLSHQVFHNFGAFIIIQGSANLSTREQYFESQDARYNNNLFD